MSELHVYGIHVVTLHYNTYTNLGVKSENTLGDSVLVANSDIFMLFCILQSKQIWNECLFHSRLTLLYNKAIHVYPMDWRIYLRPVQHMTNFPSISQKNNKSIQLTIDLYSASQKKTEPWNNGMLRAGLGVYDYYHIFFMTYD